MMTGFDLLAILLIVACVLAVVRAAARAQRRRDRAAWITDDAWRALERRARGLS